MQTATHPAMRPSMTIAQTFDALFPNVLPKVMARYAAPNHFQPVDRSDLEKMSDGYLRWSLDYDRSRRRKTWLWFGLIALTTLNMARFPLTLSWFGLVQMALFLFALDTFIQIYFVNRALTRTLRLTRNELGMRQPIKLFLTRANVGATVS